MYLCCPTKYKMFAMISDDNNFKYCARNNFDKTECIYNVVLLDIEGLS